MIVEPIVGIIHNVTEERYHPVYFKEYPLPGPPSDVLSPRYKSGGHHTTGLPTREEALTEAQKIGEALKDHCIGSVHYALTSDFAWDGEGIPAMVIFFQINGETATPLF